MGLGQRVARGLVTTPHGVQQLELPIEWQGFNGRNLTEVHPHPIVKRGRLGRGKGCQEIIEFHLTVRFELAHNGLG